jgi:tagatose-1,6-bisphosphate aldolase non-catalytic subunit AgaZ/GatZ
MLFVWPPSRAIAGVASTAAAISTTDVSFDLVIQFLHSMYQANNAGSFLEMEKEMIG